MSDWFEGVKGIIVSQDGDQQDDPDFQQSWGNVPIKYRMQIGEGIEISRAMVSSALKGLNTWDACNRGGAGKPSSDLDLAAEVDNGLHKYFHLVNQDLDRKRDGSVIRGIERVFLQIQEGLLSDQCEIRLWSFVDKRIWAAVKDDGVARPGTKASPIRATFGFTDEFGHVSWKGMAGPILLSTKWLKLPVVSDQYTKSEEIARTLVHEASHRYAGTRDILYKADSFGVELKGLDAQFSTRGQKPGESATDFVKERAFNRQMLQEESALGKITSRALPSTAGGIEKKRALGITKDLISIAPKSGKLPVAPQQWLENADSYAWFARRIWKRMGKPK